MNITEYFQAENKEHWLQEINKSEWGAGKYLYQLLSENRLKELCGDTTLVYLLTDGQRLVSFCTLAPQDDVREPAMTPWIGFVYTYPEYRGHRYVGQLLREAEKTAWNRGEKVIYISTGETGLYEKYGYSFYKVMKDFYGEDSRIYLKELEKTIK